MDLGVCYLRKDAAGLVWDTICFVFLLLQLRVYRSHYFQYVVNDLKIRNKLATRYHSSLEPSLFLYYGLLFKW